MVPLPAKTTVLIFVQILLLLLPYSVKAAACGNGQCQPGLGETYITCPQDCPSPTPTPIPTPTNTPIPTPTPTTGTGPTVTPGGANTPTPTPGSASSSSGGTSEPSPRSYPSISTANPIITTNDTTPAVTGTASVEQGEIALVEYSIDGAAWVGAKATDATFNSKIEGFVFTTPPLSEGTHSVHIRGRNSDGTYTKVAAYYHQTIIIATKPPTIQFPEIRPNPTNNQTPIIQAEMWSPSNIDVSGDVSIDNGKTWRSMKKNGRTYSVKMPLLEDDNYLVIVRAQDAAGNSVQSSQTLIIDTMPPVIGAASYSFGSQPLFPDSDGSLSLASQTRVLIDIGVKGGATEVRATVSGTSFPFVREPESYLWKGQVQLSKEGDTAMAITAIDGAGNVTTRTLYGITVVGSGTVRNAANDPVPNAVIRVYSLQSSVHEWRMWKGAVFEATNPQRTNEKGRYSIMLPKGRYYIDVRASGSRIAHSEIFDIEKTSILHQDVRLESSPVFTITLPFIGKKSITVPTLFPSSFTVRPESTDTTKKTIPLSALVGKTMPDIVVTDAAGKEVHLASLVKGPTLITFMTPWSSTSLEHLRMLSDITEQNTSGGTLVVVMLQESEDSVTSLVNRGKYRMTVLADISGRSVIPYNISLVPMHVFISKEKVIRTVHIGLLDIGMILENFRTVR